MTQQLITLLTVMCLCIDVFSVIVIHLYYMKPKIWKCSHQLFIIVILIVMIVLIEEDKKKQQMQINVRIVFFCCHTIPNSPSFTSQVYIVICISVVYTFLEEKERKK